jgi:F-type H+-transporting ATPase subunit b
MIIPHVMAATESSSSGIGALGVSLEAFVIQLITFVFVFLLLKRFAFTPIGNMLEKRRKVIEDGVKLGQKMEQEQAHLQEEAAKIIREARQEADRIIGDGQKEAREIIREAEKAGKRKVDAMLVDAEARIDEEADQARRKLEKEIAGLIAEATEAVVDEKVDSKRDAQLIEKAIKERRNK